MQSKLSLIVLAAFCSLLVLCGLTFVARSGGTPPLAAEAAAPRPVEPAAEIVASSPVQDNEKGDEPNPKLLVPPLDEPDVALDGKVSERADFVAPIQGGGFIFERKDPEGKRIGGLVIPGIVIVTRGLVELFGCGEGGKEHETIIRVESNIQALDLGLTSAGLKRGNLPSKTDINLEDQGSRVLILIQWVDKEGRLKTYRSEDLVISMRRNAPMPRVGWTYVGQWMEVADPTSPKGEKKHKVLAATSTRSIVTTFRDRSAVLDNPLEEAVDDTLFAANYMILPPVGTPVRIIFRAPTTAERKEIAALEKKIQSEPSIHLHPGKSREEQDKK